MTPAEAGVYLRLAPSVDDALAGLEAMRAAAEDARVAVLAMAAQLRAGTSTRVTRRAERRRVTRTIRRAQRRPRQDAYQRRQLLRAIQYLEHHPGRRPLPAHLARDLRALRPTTRGSTP